MQSGDEVPGKMIGFLFFVGEWSWLSSVDHTMRVDGMIKGGLVVENAWCNEWACEMQ